MAWGAALFAGAVLGRSEGAAFAGLATITALSQHSRIYKNIKLKVHEILLQATGTMGINLKKLN